MIMVLCRCADALLIPVRTMRSIDLAHDRDSLNSLVRFIAVCRHRIISCRNARCSLERRSYRIGLLSRTSPRMTSESRRRFRDR